MQTLPPLKSKKVELVWIDATPEIIGGTYMGLSRFSADVDWPRGTVWSVAVDFSADEVRARFVLPWAPADRLRKGAKFDLYNRLQRIAAITVVE